MSCPHGIWHAEDCERCVEIADHEKAYELIFSELTAAHAHIAELEAKNQELQRQLAKIAGE